MYSIIINEKRVTGKRNPMIYGHFIEHFHRQIYDPGNPLSDEQVKTLLYGKKILLKGLTSKLGKKYDAYIIPNGIEDYSYIRDGEKKSGKQFKFAMDFPKKRK